MVRPVRWVVALILASLMVPSPFQPLHAVGLSAEEGASGRETPTLLNWTDNPPTIDGINTSGEWDNGTFFWMNFSTNSGYCRMLSNGTHLFIFIAVTLDTVNDSSDWELVRINIDGDNDGNITYTDTCTTNGKSDHQPFTYCGPNVDRWASLTSAYSGGAGWLEWDVATFGLPIIYRSSNASFNTGLAEPYEYLHTNYSAGHRFYEYSIPFWTLNLTMGGELGVKLLTTDWTGAGWYIAGTLPSFVTIPQSYFPWDPYTPYCNVRLNSRPFINITAPRNGAVVGINEAVQFDASPSSDAVNPGMLNFSWDFGDGSGAGYGETTSHRFGARGQYQVNLTVTSGANISNTTTIELIVDSPPGILTFSPPQDTSMMENSTLIFCTTVNDPDADALVRRWFIDGARVNASDNTTSVGYFANFYAAGKHLVNFTVSDGLVTVRRSWNITVIDVNAPPRITEWLPVNDTVSVAEAGALQFQIKASDPDLQPLLYSWRLDGRPLAGAAAASLMFKPDYSMAGNHTLSGLASDGLLDCARHWNVNVRNVNRAPQAMSREPAENPSIGECETVELRIFAVDPDGDTLGFTWKLDGTTVPGADWAFNYTPGARDAGSHEVVVTFSDGGLTASDKWFIIVADVNQAPAFGLLSPSGNVTVNEGDGATFSATASDADGDAVTLNWLLDGEPAETRTGTYTLQAGYDFSGTHTVSVVASDDRNSTRHDWTIEVTEFNRAPRALISAPAEMSEFTTSDRIEFNGAESTDPDNGDRLNFSWSSSRDGHLGQFAAFRRNLSAGAHVITLAVDDGKGAIATATVNFTVKAPVTPILRVVSVTAPGKGYTEGDIVDISFEIANDGPLDARNVELELCVDDINVTRKAVGLVPAGLKVNVKMSWTATEGNHTFSGKLSAPGAVRFNDTSAALKLDIGKAGLKMPPVNNGTGLHWLYIVMAGAAVAGVALAATIAVFRKKKTATTPVPAIAAVEASGQAPGETRTGPGIVFPAPAEAPVVTQNPVQAQTVEPASSAGGRTVAGQEDATLAHPEQEQTVPVPPEGNLPQAVPPSLDDIISGQAPDTEPIVDCEMPAPPEGDTHLSEPTGAAPQETASPGVPPPDGPPAAILRNVPGPEDELRIMLKLAQKRIAARDGDDCDKAGAATALRLAMAFREKGNIDKALKYARRAAGKE